MAGNQFQQLAAFTASQKMKEGGFSALPPHSSYKDFNSDDAVYNDGIDMSSTAIWHSSDTDFYHEEVVGEMWNYNYAGKIKMLNYGSWGTRTPILHPAVAGIDATEAGYDDAYLRALQQVDVLTYGTRDDAKMIIRKMVERYSKLKYSPVRLLIRAVVLWAVASRNETAQQGFKTGYAAHDLAQPTRLSDAGGFSVIARTQQSSPGDVIFVQCEEAYDLSMVEVARALTARHCPVNSRMSVIQLWPELSAPRVVYMSDTSAGMGTATFDSSTVEHFLYNFCTQFDCFDLLQTAVTCVQMFLVRPAGAGLLGGARDVRIGLPNSDLRVGALGPLLAGISAEGMRTDKYIMPSWKEFAYGAAVRGCMVSASYHEALIKYDQAHPVAYTYASAAAKGRTRLLSVLSASRSMIDQHVDPILHAAGWECWPSELRNIAPISYKGFEKELFNGTRVPWWTNVLGHMTEGGLELVKDWARPAHMKEIVTPGRWYTAGMLSGATQGQITSAVRWLSARAAYVYNADIFTLRTIPIVNGTPSRFMAVLKPQIVMNGRQKAAICVQFNGGANEGAPFLRALGKAHLSAIKYVDPKSKVPVAQVGMDLINDDQGGHWSVGGPDHPLDGMPGTEEGAGPPMPDDFATTAVEVEPTESYVPPEQRSETIDWFGVTRELRELGIQSEPELFTEALLKAPEPGSVYESMANALESLDVRRVTGMTGQPRLDAARAVMYAMTRLGPHLSADSRRFGNVQGEMVKVVMEDIRPFKGKAVMHEQEELDAQASEALTEGNAAAGGVAEAHDDPEAQVETLQDFGTGPSGQDLPPERRYAEPVTAHSLMEPVGFLPPEASGPFTIQFETQDRAVGQPSGSGLSRPLPP
jgi:hypothetical protein